MTGAPEHLIEKCLHFFNDFGVRWILRQVLQFVRVFLPIKQHSAAIVTVVPLCVAPSFGAHRPADVLIELRNGVSGLIPFRPRVFEQRLQLCPASPLGEGRPHNSARVG